jgi:hypothetical protein
LYVLCMFVKWWKKIWSLCITAPYKSCNSTHDQSTLFSRKWMRTSVVCQDIVWLGLQLMLELLVQLHFMQLTRCFIKYSRLPIIRGRINRVVD